MFLPKHDKKREDKRGRCSCYEHFYHDQKKKKDKNPFCDLLKRIPPNYEVEELFVNGEDIEVERFVSIDHKTGLAYFVGDSEQVITVNCEKIDAIEWDD